MRILGFISYSVFVFFSIAGSGLWDGWENSIFNTIYFMLIFPVVSLGYVHFQLRFTVRMLGQDASGNAIDQWMGVFPLIALVLAVSVKGMMIYMWEISDVTMSDIYFAAIVLWVLILDLHVIATIQNRIQILSTQVDFN